MANASAVKSDRFHGYEIRKFKSFRGREGVGFNLDLYRDGKLAATIDNAANGGCFRFSFMSKEAEEQFNAIVEIDREQNPAKYHEFEQGDTLMVHMVDYFEMLRRWKREAKTNTLFQVGADIGGESYIIAKAPFNETTKAQLAKEHEGKPIRWINEELNSI